jgi:hypothetical protein
MQHDIIPAVRREKLMIERIGLGGLLALWSPAIGVAMVVPYACTVMLFQSRLVGAAVGLFFGSLVALRALFWIRKSLAQLRERHRRLQED